MSKTLSTASQQLVERKCVVCGSKFKVKHFRIVAGGGIVCSFSCRGKNKHGPTPIERFWGNVIKTETCWIWSGPKVGTGYGHFQVKHKHYRAHRWIYQEINGVISKELYVLHRCDNPPCVNLGHLFLGTPADNMRDRKEKGHYAVGEDHPNAKLNREQIKEIKNRIRRGEYATTIARDFSVSSSTIKDIRAGLTYRCYEKI